MTSDGGRRLTRRDALAALAAAGATAGAGTAFLALEGDGDSGEDGADGGDGALDPDVERTMVAAAEVLYPSSVDGVEAFVRRYLRGVVEDRGDDVDGIRETAAFLEDWSRAWLDSSFAELSRGEREAALRRIGADTADPDPGGTDAERVRYHVVDELLFALYSTPTGGELVGIENPPGHPGGTASYRREP